MIPEGILWVVERRIFVRVVRHIEVNNKSGACGTHSLKPLLYCKTTKIYHAFSIVDCSNSSTITTLSLLTRSLLAALHVQIAPSRVGIGQSGHKRDDLGDIMAPLMCLRLGPQGDAVIDLNRRQASTLPSSDLIYEHAPLLMDDTLPF